MRVPLHWLADFVAGPMTEATGVADALTGRGLEVDFIEPAIAAAFSGVVVAHVEDVAPHPNADRLRVCQVEAGSGQHTVVCGAPNVRPGMKVAFATVGAVLPGDFKIKKAKLRGVESQGMLCSAKELGLGEDADGIIDLATDAETGADFAALMGVDEQVLDIDLTPNRGDCFSILGVGRELTSIMGEAPAQAQVSPVPATIEARFPVTLSAPEACPQLVGRVIRGIDASAKSPLWMTERLRRAGVRAIHPVVDVTNYVMLELGQPLHGYDLDKLTGAIDVRLAKPDEPLVLLDGKPVQLSDDVLVISDGSGAVGLAGIMGGESTAVSSTTQNIFFESAYFSPQAIAGRGRRWALHTDASMRFERGVDPAGQARAIERATQLLLMIAGGEAGPVEHSVSTDHLPAREPVTLRAERLEQVLGMSLTADQIVSALEGLGLKVSAGQSPWSVTPPGFRFDIEREEDLIEEVGRVIGYDNIPPRPGAGPAYLGTDPEGTIPEHRAADWLAARGYREVMNYSFVSPQSLEALRLEGRWKLANPLSVELSVMRPSLWPGLVTSALENLSRQQDRLRLFEVGHAFEGDGATPHETSRIAGIAVGQRLPEGWANDKTATDFFDVKADVELLLAGMGFDADCVSFKTANHPTLHPGQSATIFANERELGIVGALHPGVASALDFRGPVYLFEIDAGALAGCGAPKWQPVSRYPSLRRDLDLIVDEDLAAGSLTRAARQAGGSLLTDAFVFDVYRGQGVDSGRKSIGLGLILQETSRTLTDEDADRQVSVIADHLREKLNATIRN